MKGEEFAWGIKCGRWKEKVGQNQFHDSQNQSKNIEADFLIEINLFHI